MVAHGHLRHLRALGLSVIIMRSPCPVHTLFTRKTDQLISFADIQATLGGTTFRHAYLGSRVALYPRRGGSYVQVDRTGFTVEPLDPHTSCTPATVAAHMLYENADPFRMREPSGTLDTSQAVYTARDDRSVRAEGSQFEKARQATIKPPARPSRTTRHNDSRQPASRST
jgi:Acyclic terpene utilisation family protein AtuA